jgi:prophage regulatory protein
MNIEQKLLRLRDVLKLIPISKSTWWAGIQSGIYPQPVYIAPRIPAWRRTDLEHIIEHGITDPAA